METKFKINFKINEFEEISETTENQLVGGFSSSISLTSSQAFAVEDNNCNGGNCTSGCGTGQNVLQCNTVSRCGS